MSNEEPIPWNIQILPGGEIKIPEGMPLPEPVIVLLREKIAERPELHGGDYIVRCERWGQRWLPDHNLQYTWHPIYVGGSDA